MSAHESMEHAEHAEHASGENKKIALLIAVIALCLALSETLGKGAQTESISKNVEASNLWAFFQAKSIKKNSYEIAAAMGGPAADQFQANAKRNEADGEEIQAKATEYEKQVDEKLRDSDIRAHRHHVLTFGVTLLHISIAVATLSIITRGKRWPWMASLALGAFGMIAAGFAYV